MPATAAFLALATLAAQQAPPTKFYSEGQEVRVCGEVKTIRAVPPACDATMRVSSSTGEEFDVVLPAWPWRRNSPSALRSSPGAQACFTGRIAAVPGIPKVNVGFRRQRGTALHECRSGIRRRCGDSMWPQHHDASRDRRRKSRRTPRGHAREGAGGRRGASRRRHGRNRGRRPYRQVAALATSTNRRSSR